MRVIKTPNFEKTFKKLPKDINRLYAAQEKRFLSDWKDARLHVKKIKALGLAFSFRITRRYRVLFYFQNPDTAIFFDIDHRNDIYR